jgi:hypothetical protein
MGFYKSVIKKGGALGNGGVGIAHEFAAVCDGWVGVLGCVKPWKFLVSVWGVVEMKI